MEGGGGQLVVVVVGEGAHHCSRSADIAGWFVLHFFAKLSLQDAQSISVNVHLITCMMENLGAKRYAS